MKAGRPKSSEIMREELGILLSYPVVTRWNSTYDSVQKIISREEKLSVICTKLELPAFTEEDMLYLKDYASAMKPFADALDFLQGEKGVFYGTLIPTLVTIKTKIDRIINNGKENYLKQQLIFLQSRLFDRFEKYFTLSSEINDAIVAAVLHPEVKLQWFAPIRDLTRKSVDEVKKLVIDYVADNHVVDCDAAEDLILSRIGSFYDFGDEQNSFGSKK
ncbi:PREDICTED: uncharacterized protein LOC108357330 [Rhagoletis zephyria]|uniref:uncharacterized protein LOC108357330 n=1 Tax=Rhagoletis zephyria TaxID=28612 RepID=UPI0008112EF1|nr:PREDICTED: uncharacterized protein LOC108357330 [Rhagoletis zephyria]